METQNSIRSYWDNKASKHSLALLFGVAIFIAHASESEAKKKPDCSGTLKSSTYFVPDVKDYCRSSEPCAKFRSAVSVEGSGSLPGNKLLLPSGKKQALGDCKTAFGASGNCLIPFISVAADRRYHKMGEIIQVPSLKGKTITMPNGKEFVHPGYFVVQDVGTAIKGANRFDFFTGSYSDKNAKNPFGYNFAGGGGIGNQNKIPSMGNRESCDGKQFSALPRSQYDEAMAEINEAKLDQEVRTSSSKTNLASGNAQ